MNDSQHNSDAELFEQLLSDKCNGTLSPEGHAQLHALLASRPELRRDYWATTAIHADLGWDIASKDNFSGEFLNLLAEGFGGAPARMTRRRGRFSATIQRWGWGPALAAGLAAILLGGWAVARLANRGPGGLAQDAAEEPVGSARLAGLASDSRWSLGRPGDWNPTAISYGDTLWVEEGLVEIRIDGGTVGQLHAPAALQIIDENRVRLLSGKINVNAPERTNGFTVETPSAEIVDLGTVFSVEAADAGTDLVVYGGKVDLKVPQRGGAGEDRPHTTKQFTAGQAVHVSRNGTLSRIMNVQSSAHKVASGAPAPQPLIASVVDNIVRDDLWAFYKIVQGGMAEDAYCFVDRLHEWNGETAAGMPSYLLGGDYVKTFNDDKLMDEYKVDVELTQPAILYVLLDMRVDPPKWLTDSFSDTGDRIGIDETHHHRPGPEATSEVGPGNSIDRTHSIWKLVVPEGGTVVLGPNGKAPSNTPWHNNMYGLVAVPLEQGGE